MASNPRVAAAFHAMRDIGIKKDQVKPVLEKLLKLYDKNWEFIEDENYRVLADAIFEEYDNMVTEQEKKKKRKSIDDEDLEDEAERPLKRLCGRNQGDQVTFSASVCRQSLGGILLKEPKVEDKLPELCSQQWPRDTMETSWSTIQTISHLCGPVSKGKKPLLPQIPSPRKRSMPERASCVRISEPIIGPHIGCSPKQKALATDVLVKPKDEPFTDEMFAGDVPPYEVPIQMIHPGSPGKLDSSAGNNSVENRGPEVQASRHLDEGNGGDGIRASSSKGGTKSKFATIPDECPRLEIASSLSGEVKLCLRYDSALGRPDFHMPHRDEFIKLMEDRCCQTYKVVDPNFSVKKLLNDMCEGFLELGTHSADESHGTGSRSAAVAR